MRDASSETTLRRRTRNFRRSSASATAGPETSVFSPRAHESLTVRTAAVRSTVEEDIFSLGGVALRLIQLAQAFHQQALCVQGRRFLGSFSVEVDLKASIGPAQNLEDRFVASDRTISRVLHLPLAEVHLAFVIAVGHGERTTLAAHFERLNEIHNVHLRKAAAQD